MGDILQVQFMVQILLAELIFLYPSDKRAFFWPRFAGAILVCIVAAYFFPSFDWPGQLNPLFRYVALFSLSIAAMGFCFKISLTALVSSCSAGYAVQHIAHHCIRIMRKFGLLSFLRTDTDIPVLRFAAAMAPYLVFFLFFLLTIGLYSARHECYKKVDMRFNTISIGIVVICIGLSRAAGYFQDSGSVTVSLYAIAACLMALIVQLVLSRTVELQHENQTVNLLWKEDRKQYETSKKTIETFNIKYHDLKHKLRDMNLSPEDVAAIKDAVRVFRSRYETGNEALDVLLSENTIRLSEENIVLTYTGNGADLSFMSAMDVYSLFGNAVENAVEAVRKVEDPEKRVIDIMTEKHGNMLNVRVSNYYSGTISIENGLPVTTKPDAEGYHGFGMKSMKLVAEKYGGDLICSTDGEIFDLWIYLINE